MTTDRRYATAYLLGFIVSIATFCALLVPAAPLFIKLLWPFPTLDQTTHLSGRIEMEGGHSSNLMTPRSYVVTPEGRMEFKCGYFGDRYACQNYQLFHEATGEVWHHPAYGAVQWRLTIGAGPRKGRLEESPIDADRAYHEHRFNYSKYISKLLVALVALACAAWQLLRFMHHRSRAA